MDEPIPLLRRPEDTPPLRTQEDLHRYWRSLLGELGFSERLLWFTLVDADQRVTPMLSQLEDVPRFPDQELLDSLMDVLSKLLETALPDGSAALLLSRPGRAAMTESDRVWAASLTEAAARAGVWLQPIHLATDQALRVFAPDDLCMPKIA